MKNHKFVSVDGVCDHQVQQLFNKVTPLLNSGWTLVNGSMQFIKTRTGFAGIEKGTWACLISKETRHNNLDDEDF